MVEEYEGVQSRRLSSAPHCARVTIAGLRAVAAAVASAAVASAAVAPAAVAPAAVAAAATDASAVDAPGSTVTSWRFFGAGCPPVSTRTWIASAEAVVIGSVATVDPAFPVSWPPGAGASARSSPSPSDHWAGPRIRARTPTSLALPPLGQLTPAALEPSVPGSG